VNESSQTVPPCPKESNPVEGFTRSRPDLKLPSRRKPSIFTTRIIDYTTIVIDDDADDDLEADYRGLETPAAEFQESVSYVRSSTPSIITTNNTILNNNTDSSCYIDATFEMLWHCVMPWVADLFDKKQIEVVVTSLTRFYCELASCTVLKHMQVGSLLPWKFATSSGPLVVTKRVTGMTIISY
jgi:hypothetical protein